MRAGTYGRVVSSATTRALASRVEHTRRRLDATFAGRYANELVELRVIDRALAVASKLFIAVLPISILSTAVVSGNSFGDELVRRFGLTDSAPTPRGCCSRRRRRSRPASGCSAW